MATLTINIPDAILTRVLDGVAGNLAFTRNGQIGETKAAFAKRMVIEYVMGCVRAYEEQAAQDAARATTNTDIQLT